jgi:DNA modification methylase
MKVARELGRNSIGIEIKEELKNIILQKVVSTDNQVFSTKKMKLR